jgi:hypothetical protein
VRSSPGSGTAPQYGTCGITAVLPLIQEDWRVGAKVAT